MVEKELGIGERREAARRRTRIILFSAIGISGMLTGMLIGYNEGRAAFFSNSGGLWTPTLALALAALYFIAVVGGSLILARNTDELQQQTSQKAGAIAGAVFITVYPIWFLLWKGGFVGEPIHWVLYVLFIVTSAGALLVSRFR